LGNASSTTGSAKMTPNSSAFLLQVNVLYFFGVPFGSALLAKQPAEMPKIRSAVLDVACACQCGAPPA
jgi:hypothetical protein